MSGWADFTSLAKTAISTAQKRIDKVLDIKEEEGGESLPDSTSGGDARIQDDFFTAFGLNTSQISENVSGKEGPDSLDDSAASSSGALNLSSASEVLNVSKWFSSPKTEETSKKTSTAKPKWSSWLGGTSGDEESQDLKQSTEETPATTQEEPTPDETTEIKKKPTESRRPKKKSPKSPIAKKIVAESEQFQSVNLAPPGNDQKTSEDPPNQVECSKMSSSILEMEEDVLTESLLKIHDETQEQNHRDFIQERVQILDEKPPDESPCILTDENKADNKIFEIIDEPCEFQTVSDSAKSETQQTQNVNDTDSQQDLNPEISEENQLIVSDPTSIHKDDLPSSGENDDMSPDPVEDSGNVERSSQQMEESVSQVDWGQSGWTRSTVCMESDRSVILSQPSPQITDSSSTASLERTESSTLDYNSSLEGSETRSQATIIDTQQEFQTAELDNDSPFQLEHNEPSVPISEELLEAEALPPAAFEVQDDIDEPGVSGEAEEPLKEEYGDSPTEGSLEDSPIRCEPLSVVVHPEINPYSTCDLDDKTPEGLMTETHSDGSGEVERASSSSMAESFVRLESGEGSPPCSNQKSETSSIVKGSGYTSPSDELETAASSDIEVISVTNGDNTSERSSRSGIIVVDHARITKWNEEAQGRSFTPGSEGHNRTGSYGFSLDTCGTGEGEQDPAILTQTLEARERKLVELSKENMQFVEENQELRVNLQQLQLQMKNVGDLEKSLSNLQSKYSAVHEERDAYRQRCERLEREESSSGSTVAHLQRLLREKEEQVQEFTREGEKLSKRELKHTTIIKKLREKEKETEKLMEAQKQKLTEMDSLRQKLKEKGEQEITYDEAIHQLKSTAEKLEKRNAKLMAEQEDWKEKTSTLRASVDSCHKQIAELTRDASAKSSEITKLKLLAEASKETELKTQLETFDKERASERQEMMRQMEELRVNLIQASGESDRRESGLRWEIGQLQKKLEEAENRNQELSDEVRAATKPLLRQIDSLQSSHGTQQGNWERLEKALYDRIHDAEKKVLDASEKERDLQTVNSELRGSLAQTKAQLNAISKEKTLLEAERDSQRKTTEAAADQHKRHELERERERREHWTALEDAQREKELVAQQFDVEKAKMKSQFDERKNEFIRQIEKNEETIANMRSELLEKGQQMSMSTTGPSRNVFDTRSISPATVNSFNVVDDGMEDSWSWGEGAGMPGLMEKLRERLQQKEGEAGIMRNEMKTIQQSRDSATVQLAQLSNRLHELEEKLSTKESIESEYTKLDAKYQALLQIFGEKVEENEELRLDLQDVKTMYRQQIQDLLNE